MPARLPRCLLTGGSAALLLFVWSAAAQQTTDRSDRVRPPSWAQGRPAGASTSPLAPLGTSGATVPADRLPIDKLTAPDGYNIEVYAASLGSARALRQGDKGTVFVGSAIDRIYAILDRDGRREVKTLYTGLERPSGIAFKNGTLYIAEVSKISKVEHIEDHLDNPPRPVVIYSDLPNDAAHGRKYLAVGPDDRLYFQVGAPCNICIPAPGHGEIRRINLDGSGAEVVGRGIRQVMGMDWSPVTRQLYFTENSRDWFSEDLPEDKLNRLADPGKDNFGFPYCHQGNIADQEFGWGRSCDEFTKPVGLLGAHSAALGMRFYTGSGFPSEYRDAIFIARHGSWNRTKKTGGDIAVGRVDKSGALESLKPFVSGFIQNNDYVGRPADIVFLADGSMLISDDYDGAVYRVTYHGSASAGH